MNVIFIKKCTTLGKNSRFGHTSFIKVVINATIATKRNAISHERIENPGTIVVNDRFLC